VKVYGTYRVEEVSAQAVISRDRTADGADGDLACNHSRALGLPATCRFDARGYLLSHCVLRRRSPRAVMEGGESLRFNVSYYVGPLYCDVHPRAVSGRWP
jgi:hypothetical protein